LPSGLVLGTDRVLPSEIVDIATSGEITTFAYDAANQLTTSEDAAGTTNYVYDGAGNLRTATDPSGGITTNTWDDDNRHSAPVERFGCNRTFLCAK